MTDDKIVAVLEADPAFGHVADIAECPPALVERLRHYFLTYKDMPDTGSAQVEITHVYGAAEAREVLACALENYRAVSGRLRDGVGEALD